MPYQKKRGIPPERSMIAAMLGAIGGRKTSAAKVAAVARNGACPRRDGKRRGNVKGCKFPNRKRPTPRPK